MYCWDEIYIQKFKPSLIVLCLLQNAIAMHESNGIDIIIALLLNDINPLGRQRMDLVLELKVRHSYSHTLTRENSKYELHPDTEHVPFIMK